MPRATSRSRRGASPGPASARSAKAVVPSPPSERRRTLSKGTSATTTLEHFEFEFGGVVGTTAIMVVLPVFHYVLLTMCDFEGCLPDASEAADAYWPPSKILHGMASMWSWPAAGVVVGWVALHVVLFLVLPGASAQGVVLADGSRLTYVLNGFRALAVCVVLLVAGDVFGWFHLASIYDMSHGLFVGAVAFSFLTSVWLYWRAKSQGTDAAPNGSSGSLLYDFFMGAQLNPRVTVPGFRDRPIDVKSLLELRPGLIGWAVLNLGYAMAQLERHGTLSNSMVLVCAFQWYYVVDALWMERSLLTTMDIVSDGLGHMLVYGDLVYVPFPYALQARYLVNNPVHLPMWAIVAVCGVKCIGFWFFRGANKQKDTFRRDPNDPAVRGLKTMQTKRGTKLIVSGVFWGVSRHINYFGDWLMGLSWCLLTGFSTPVTYFYVIQFFVLLVHRERRDDAWCRSKYGPDWERYCSIVKYRIVPFVY